MAYKYNEFNGVIYDAIYINIIYFNKQIVKNYFKQYNENGMADFTYCDEFMNGFVTTEPPEELYPFFFYDGATTCVFTSYLFKYFDFTNGTFSSCLSLIQDIPRFKRFVFIHFMEPLKMDIDIEKAIKGDPVEIGKALVALKPEKDLAYACVYLFNNFEKLAKGLYGYMETVIRGMNVFHLKKKDLMKTAIKEFYKEENANMYKKSCGINDDVDFIKQTYSVCLMNKYVTIYAGSKKNYVFIIGIDSPYIIKKDLSYQFVTHTSTGKLFANDITNNIINALSTQEMTINQLSEKLNVSRSTAERFILHLFNELAIKKIKKVRNEQYYQLNPDYFIAAKEAFNKSIDKILLNNNE